MTLVGQAGKNKRNVLVYGSAIIRNTVTGQR
jgi:hypothetical protein